MYDIETVELAFQQICEKYWGEPFTESSLYSLWEDLVSGCSYYDVNVFLVAVYAGGSIEILYLNEHTCKVTTPYHITPKYYKR